MRSSFLIATGLSVAYAQLQSEYDYVICGGGTAGLVLANKLSADLNTQVLVVEAGANVSPDEPAGQGVETGWAYKSQPQIYAGGQIMDLPAGKILGGSSQINGKAYVRPDASEIDNWGQVNDASWSWEVLFPFYKSSESLSLPSSEQEDAGNTVNKDFHGFNGPVNTTFPAVGTPNFFNILEGTAANVSIPRNKDFNGGAARGLSTYPGTYRIEGEREQFRESAREAYYLGIASRKNLEVLAGTSCLRITWADGSSGDNVTASGVEIANSNNLTTVSVRKEVIVSAGSYRSPTILEYSGVGNPKILANYNITTKIDLPGVGENLQDQMQGSITYSLSNTSNISFPDAVGNEITTNYLMHVTYEDIFGDGAAEIQARVNSSLSAYASTISKRINGSITAEQILNSLQVQYDTIFNRRAPAVELFTNQALTRDSVTLEFWPLQSLGRGNVHISGANAQAAGAQPIIDHNYFITDYDWDIYIAAARWVRRFFATAPLVDSMGEETRPGLAKVTQDASDEEWKAFYQDNFRAGWHAVGSAAMLPRAWGGVVNGDLQVYGTANVRVCDASVIPFILGGHPTSTLYAMAERAAELIIRGTKG
ncbi:glucose oxidase [Lecanosticta acicola]|uniref:Glucose oxidase n=1 Tax=Lecanosticta acicola TaxID=111012 RepID=A0AAI8YV14_9PEZI|nr:glucose oxidase [Lecanosticta acicola]